MSEATELRCPNNFRRMFGKLRGGPLVIVSDGNLIEFACTDCARELRRVDPGIVQVLHRYNLLGEMVQTVATRRASESS